MPANDQFYRILLWFVTGGGAGTVSYWLMEHVAWLTYLKAEYKRYVSVALSAFLAMAAYAVAVGLSYQESPGNVQAWLEALFAAASVAVVLSQVVHGRRKLRA